MVGGSFFREIRENLWELKRRIAQMEEVGVSMQVLSTVPVMFSYWAKPDDALDLSRRLNDHIAGVARDHPTRFTGLGTIPMQDPDLAAGELERCVRDLGLRGAQIGTHVDANPRLGRIDSDGMSREEAADKIRALGGTFQTAVAKDTTYLVAGGKVGESKLKKAQAYGTKIITGDDLKALLS